MVLTKVYELRCAAYPPLLYSFIDGHLRTAQQTVFNGHAYILVTEYPASSVPLSMSIGLPTAGAVMGRLPRENGSERTFKVFEAYPPIFLGSANEVASMRVMASQETKEQKAESLRVKGTLFSKTLEMEPEDPNSVYALAARSAGQPVAVRTAKVTLSSTSQPLSLKSSTSSSELDSSPTQPSTPLPEQPTTSCAKRRRADDDTDIASPSKRQRGDEK